MKATGIIRDVDHRDDCPELKQMTTAARPGKKPGVQKAIWFFNAVVKGNRTGRRTGGKLNWFEFRCKDYSCPAEMLLREDYVLERAGYGKFIA